MKKIKSILKSIARFILELIISIINYIKNHKIVGVIGGIILLVLLYLILPIGGYKKVYKKKIKASMEIEKYLDCLDNSEEDFSKYVNYSVVYAYNEMDEKSLSQNELLDIINSHINKEITLSDLDPSSNGAINSGYNFTYDGESNYFVFYNSSSIKKDKIFIYVLDDVVNLKKNNYNFIYNKYAFSPDDLIDYYKDDKDSLKVLEDYLNGNGKIKNIKDLITEEVISKYGDKYSVVNVFYYYKSGKMLFDHIEN